MVGLHSATSSATRTAIFTYQNTSVAALKAATIYIQPLLLLLTFVLLAAGQHIGPLTSVRERQGIIVFTYSCCLLSYSLPRKWAECNLPITHIKINRTTK